MREVYRLAPAGAYLRSFDDYPDVVRIRASVPSIYKLLMGVLVVFWCAAVVIAGGTAIMAVRDAVDEVDVPGIPLVVATPQASGAVASAEATPEPPFGVPPGAVRVTGPVLLGDIADAIVFWHDAECKDGLLTVFTNKVTLYREFDCSQMLPADISLKMKGTPVRIRTEGEVLLVEALFVGTFRFPPDRWWAVAV